jgi:hypothetical protein
MHALWSVHENINNAEVVAIVVGETDFTEAPKCLNLTGEFYENSTKFLIAEEVEVCVDLVFKFHISLRVK